MCAQPAPTDASGAPPQPPRRGPQISPVQWVGLAVLILLIANQMGLLQFGSGGLGLGGLEAQLPHWVALIVGITFHEFSHGLVATWFGDTVPKRAGRLTLNPLKHLDPLGTLMILIGPIGWGKPMPINPAGMRNPNLGWALSSAAGPISNILIATLTLVVAMVSGIGLQNPFVVQLFLLNLGLAVFNLVPLPPLDGFGFIFGLAPRPLKAVLAPIWQIGPILLLALLFLPGVIPGFPNVLQTALLRAERNLGGFLLELTGALQ